jgi:hypothetical protein
MASAAIDHMFSLIVFMVAILLFIGIFNQSMGAAVAYQQHKACATKNSDLLDAILLNPGAPLNWGQSDDVITSFGLHNPESAQYKLSPFSLMRLTSTVNSPVYCDKNGRYYNNLTSGFGGCLLTPIDNGVAKSVNYSSASELLGINGTYGFQLTLVPTVTVSVEKTSTGSPLKFLVSVAGSGSPLANANVSYSLLLVNQEDEYPSFSIRSGKSNTDVMGSVPLTFSGVNGESESYALLVYVYLYGLRGMGYYVHVPGGFSDSVVPLVESFADGTINIVHSSVVGGPASLSQLNYNASYLILTKDYTLCPVELNDPDEVGVVDSLSDFPSVKLPSDAGIMVLTYKDEAAGRCGIVLTPWGLSTLAYPVTFGGNPSGYDWVTTDFRQVTIGEVSYMAKLALWRLGGVTR